VGKMLAERKEQQGGGESEEDGRENSLHGEIPSIAITGCREGNPAANHVSFVGRMRATLSLRNFEYETSTQGEYARLSLGNGPTR
jgi:hypothetical protein